MYQVMAALEFMWLHLCYIWGLIANYPCIRAEEKTLIPFAVVFYIAGDRTAHAQPGLH
jgi:hypothetical protein